MPQPEPILLVVSILEGRNFPNLSSDCQLTVEARFDGEILVTDPVELSTTPNISQELAWELDKKTFQHHKLQRSVIKCNVHQTRPGGQREMIGYFIVQVRPLSNVQTDHWYQLLQTKYHKLRPEISISAYIEDDQTGGNSSSASKSSKTTPKTGPSSAGATRSRQLQPVLIEDKGYYQLGPDNSTAEIFTLFITLHSADNLIHLFPAKTDFSIHNGYFFNYSLFGNHVTSETFQDLIRPEFRPERATVHIRSTIQLLRSYFETFHPIELSLWSGEEMLAQGQIPLNRIVKPLQQKSTFDVLTEDFQVSMSPSTSQGKRRTTDDDEETRPTVNVNVKLSRANPLIEEKSSSERSHRTRSVSFNQNTSATQPEPESNVRVHPLSDDRVPASTFDNATDQHLSHHYCLSIDLKSLRNLRLTHSRYLYCRYLYPFLGTSTPIMTHPPLHIPYTSSAPPNEHLLPHGLCIFNFAVNAEQLSSHFHREPLTIEIYDRDQERSERKDQLYGLASIHLEQVLNAEKQRCSSNVNGILGWRQTWTQVLSIIGTNREKCGELLVTITLEDLGSLHLNAVATARPSSAPPQNAGLDAVFQRPGDDAQLQAAYELQLWKESKELEFEQHLREVEAKKIYELVEAFKEKDRERESLLQKKMKEYGELEKQMKKTVADLEKREKQLSVSEQEIQRMHVDMKRDYDNKYVEIREASKRLQEQSEHHITMEKNKNQALEEEIQRLKRSAADWEKRYRDKEHEFFSFKEKQRSTPEVKLQAEINMLTLEKNELQRKLESSISSAERYKQQWLKALKEYQRLKQREQEQSKVLLQRQQQELEHMRLRYLAAEENEILKTDHKQLETIKNELNKLKEKSSSPTIVGDLGSVSRPSEDNDHLEQVDQQLGVLIEHRDTLLQTGTYTHNDALIQELERRIQEAMKRKSSSNPSVPHSHRYQ